MIKELINDYIKENRNSINLIASENSMICDCSIAYQKEIALRYVSDNDSSGATFPEREELKKIKQMTIEKLKSMIKAKYVNISPISGLNCMLYTIGGLTKFGDLVYSIPLDCGGHGVTKPLIKKIGIMHKFLPFNREKQDVNLEQLKDELAVCKPRMVYLDFMNICWNIDVKRLKSVLPKETILVYDASHIMGLILGEAFENPLDSGADIVIGSMHKTYPGVHKGIIATNRRIINDLLEHNGVIYISHDHISDIIALGLTVEEFEKKGIQYARQTVLNAKYLSACLKNNGFSVSEFNNKFTDTHQIWIKCESEAVAIKYLYSLMKKKIYANVIRVPFSDKYGIRLGIQEITLLGYGEKELSDLSKTFEMLKVK